MHTHQEQRIVNFHLSRVHTQTYNQYQHVHYHQPTNIWMEYNYEIVQTN